MIYDDAGMVIDNDIQGLLVHFQYDCSDYNGDPRDMEDTCQAIQSLLANPRMMGEVGRAILVMASVAAASAGPHKKELARMVLGQIKSLYPEEYRQVREFHRMRE